MKNFNKDNLYIATFAGDAIEVSSEYGLGLEINDLCISVNLNEENRPGVVDRIKREIETVYGESWFSREETRRQKVIFHGPFTELTPDSIDPKAIDLMKDRYLAAIIICEIFGCKDLVLHDGYIPLLYQKSWHVKKSIGFWEEFLSEIPRDMNLYIENVFDDEPETLMEIISKVSHENFKICMDIGHANCMADKDFPVVQWIKRMGPHIGHFHLHNNDGTKDQHNDINDGTLPIDSILQVIDEYCSQDVTFTIESRRSRASVEYLLNGRNSKS